MSDAEHAYLKLTLATQKRNRVGWFHNYAEDGKHASRLLLKSSCFNLDVSNGANFVPGLVMNWHDIKGVNPLLSLVQSYAEVFIG